MTTLSNLQLSGWRQFHDINIDFHPRLTVLTGTNGTGKTTLLQVLSHGLSEFNKTYLASRIEVNNGFENYIIKDNVINRYQHGGFIIGKIKYNKGSDLNIYFNGDSNSIQYSLSYSYYPENIKGAFLSCQSRGKAKYEQITQLSSLIDPLQAFQSYKIAKGKDEYPNKVNPFFDMKNTLVAMAAFGAGNEFLQKDENALKTFKGFIEVLRKILPKSLGFINLQIRMPEVVLVTETGDFLIDSASTGMLSLIELAWMIHLLSQSNEEAVFVIDEPENHLHPEMQRQVMPKLLEAFPKAQFIVATHSPFVVSSVEDCSVYALKYKTIAEGDRQVISEKLALENRDGSAEEILEEALGVPSSIPIWMEEKLRKIADKYVLSEMSEAKVMQIKEDLAAINEPNRFAQTVAFMRH